MKNREYKAIQVNFISNQRIQQENNPNRNVSQRLNRKLYRRQKLLLRDLSKKGIQVDSLESDTQEKRELLKRYLPAIFVESYNVDVMQPLEVGLVIHDAVVHPENYFKMLPTSTEKNKYKSEYIKKMENKDKSGFFSKNPDLEGIIDVEQIRNSISSLSDEEFEDEINRVVAGPRRLISSLKGKGRSIEIRGYFDTDENSIAFCAAYASAIDTYKFAKASLRKRSNTKLRVKTKSREYEYKDAREVLEDAARRILLLEKYVERS